MMVSRMTFMMMLSTERASSDDAGAKMIISMMVLMMAFPDDGLGDDVNGDRSHEDGLDNYLIYRRDGYGIDDDGIDGECELRYEMLFARYRYKLEYAGAKMIICMIIWMMVSMIW
jgi:hypothetical protein